MRRQAFDRLEQGRASFERRSWAAAHQSLVLADRAAPLSADDLERLAIAAYLIGREGDFLSAIERAHQVHLGSGATSRAARSAFWLGLVLLFRGEPARANGWLARARRLIADTDCPEQGYLELPAAEQKLRAGDPQAALEKAADAAAIGERFGDVDLVVCARHVEGRALLEQGRVESGLVLLDEAMVAVAARELSPIMTGLVYCSVIEACRRTFALGRAREWTAALAEWCAEQPEMVAFSATCLVHRAEILELHGAWPEAIAEARRACERSALGMDQRAPGDAFYRQGEVHRLRGELGAAEEDYQRASECGCEPQPGLALLRLAQGRTRAAAAALRRVLGATADPFERLRLLPSFVEILLAGGAAEEARAACDELDRSAARLDTDVLGAMTAQARGALELAAGDAVAALGRLRRAREVWLELEAPYPAARARELMGLACRALGDDDGAELELAAARAAYEHLGAASDLARLDARARPLAAAGLPRPLTRRELEVLRLVAAGKTNRGIASELTLSEKTIERHLSNIFTKLDVSSRTAATAYAYEHHLL